MFVNGAIGGVVGGEQFSGLREQVTIAGADQAEVAHFAGVRSEDVSQEATDEPNVVHSL